MKLIGIAGPAGAGKDTISSYLWERYGYTRIAFADPLKQVASALFGIPSINFIDRDLKESNNEYWGMSHREMIQRLNGVKDIFGDDIWVSRWNYSYSAFANTDNISVPDVRFEEEAKFIRHLGGVIVHVLREGSGLKDERAASHVSEKGIYVEEGDYILHNNGSIRELYEALDILEPLIQG